MPSQRKTAVVEIRLPSNVSGESLPLTHEREFDVNLCFDGESANAKSFLSPLNDAMWRDFLTALSKCNVDRSRANYVLARNISDIGSKLYSALAGLNPDLADFLNKTTVPRRLVIQTRRPELHLLPWGALCDADGNFLACGDLSIVQCWPPFAFDKPLHFSDTINLVQDFGSNTRCMTANSLTLLPPEITRNPMPHGDVDLLHMEEHGDRILNQVGGEAATAVLRYKEVGIALLWSCFSNSGGNSWGDSPALLLHRGGDPDAPTPGAALVLSFQAELNYADAKSISEAFYADVFGPAASRDPETALVHIRAAKFNDEFEFANWASMTVYLRRPLDLSALPLNGPRVPSFLWSDSPDEMPDTSTPELAQAWAAIEATVAGIQPGSITLVGYPANDAKDEKKPQQAARQAANGSAPAFDLALDPPAKIPRKIFEAWRGNVIRLDGPSDPLFARASNAFFNQANTLPELNLDPADAPATGDADRLLWFFERIHHFGAPLIVWTNCRDYHANFLKMIEPPATLTFLLIPGKAGDPSLTELGNLNQLAKVREKYSDTTTDNNDHIAAYFAFARAASGATEQEARQWIAKAELCIARIQDNDFERLLLEANFVSRFKALARPKDQLEQAGQDRDATTPGEPGNRISGLKKRQCEEDLYRQALEAASGDTLLRDRGRARHELAYCMSRQAHYHTADALYRMALADLDRSPHPQGDDLWHYALGTTLRDWADLLAKDPADLDRAGDMLDRALATHAFHGRTLQIAYALSTRAQIALTGCHLPEAINDALDSCNLFEECGNWDGWVDAFGILLDALALNRETGFMLGLIALADKKIRNSGLAESARKSITRTLEFRSGQAHWLAGDLDLAREELAPFAKLVKTDPVFAASEIGQQVIRFTKFLGSAVAARVAASSAAPAPKNSQPAVSPSSPQPVLASPEQPASPPQEI